jgi:two-component system, OmpR family, phosphate regulon response regulator PhoB
MRTSNEKTGRSRRRRDPVVLVVEDDEGCRDEVRQVLENAEYFVLEAADGEEALRLLLSDQTPDPVVIVLDIWLPGMTGPELLRLLRNYHRFARIPVILTSASHAFADYVRINASEAGWMPKPFDSATLLAEVGKRCGSEPSSGPASIPG